MNKQQPSTIPARVRVILRSRKLSGAISTTATPLAMSSDSSPRRNECRRRGRLRQLRDGDQILPAIGPTDGLFRNHNCVAGFNDIGKDTTIPQRTPLTAHDGAVCANDEYHLGIGLVGWAARLAKIPARVAARSIRDGIRVVYLSAYNDEFRPLGNEQGVATTDLDIIRSTSEAREIARQSHDEAPGHWCLL